MDATQQGVSAREQQMESIIAAREADTEDIGGAEAPTENAEPVVDFLGADGTVYQVPVSARLKAKVDGVEVEETLDRMTRGYQKGAAADRRLEEATARQRQLEQRESELDQREQQYRAQVLEAQRKSLSEDGYQDKAKKLLHALTESDDPEVAIADVLRGITPDRDEIIAQAEQRTLSKITAAEQQRRQAALEQARLDANARFEVEYADVMEDPILYRAARNLAADKWKESPNAEPWEIAKATGDEVRAWRSKSLPQGARPKPTPTAVTGRASIGQDEKPETRNDVIAEMRKQRGQPVL